MNDQIHWKIVPVIIDYLFIYMLSLAGMVMFVC